MAQQFSKGTDSRILFYALSLSLTHTHTHTHTHEDVQMVRTGLIVILSRMVLLSLKQKETLVGLFWVVKDSH